MPCFIESILFPCGHLSANGHAGLIGIGNGRTLFRKCVS